MRNKWACAIAVMLVFLLVNAQIWGAPEARVCWLYEDGQFEHGKGKRWLETFDKGGEEHFREVERNSDYIELYDRSRDIAVRLYSKKMYLKQPGEETYQYFRSGSWGESRKR
jgi:hypothetical protein